MAVEEREIESLSEAEAKSVMSKEYGGGYEAYEKKVAGKKKD